MTWQRRSNDQPGIAFDARLRVIQPPIFLQAGLKDCLTPLHTTEECRLLFGQLSLHKFSTKSRNFKYMI